MSLAPELGLIAFSPLAQLADTATFADGAPGPGALRRSRRPPAPRAGSVSSAGRATLTGAPPATGSPAPRGSAPGSQTTHTQPAARAAGTDGPSPPTGAEPAASAPRSPDVDAAASSATRHALVPGAKPESGARAPEPFELLESVVRDAEASLRSSSGRPAAPARSQTATESIHVPASSGRVADPTRVVHPFAQPSETAPAPLVPSSPSAARDAPTGGEPPAGSPNVPAPVPLDQLRRMLLDTPLVTGNTHLPAATPGGTTARRVPAAGSTPVAATRGTDAVAAGTAALDPADVAWLVNEALIEQARRHGVDLT